MSAETSEVTATHDPHFGRQILRKIPDGLVSPSELRRRLELLNLHPERDAVFTLPAAMTARQALDYACPEGTIREYVTEQAPVAGSDRGPARRPVELVVTTVLDNSHVTFRVVSRRYRGAPQATAVPVARVTLTHGGDPRDATIQTRIDPTWNTALTTAEHETITALVNDIETTYQDAAGSLPVDTLNRVVDELLSQVHAIEVLPGTLFVSNIAVHQLNSIARLVQAVGPAGRHFVVQRQDDSPTFRDLVVDAATTQITTALAALRADVAAPPRDVDARVVLTTKLRRLANLIRHHRALLPLSGYEVPLAEICNTLLPALGPQGLAPVGPNTEGPAR